MPRIRSIKPELLRQPEFALVSPAAIACYVGLMPHADDYGRYRHHPRLIKADVFPMHPERIVGEGHIEEWVDELLEPGLLCRYVVGQRMYLHFPNWADFQKVDKPSQPSIPLCPREPHGILASPREPSGGVASPREDPRALDPRARALEGKGGEGKGREEERKPPAVAQERRDAGALIAAYVDVYTAKAGHGPPGNVKGQLAKQLGQMLNRDGIPFEAVRDGLTEWMERDLHPSVLPSIVEAKARGGRPRPPAGRQGPTDRAREVREQMRRMGRGRDHGNQGDVGRVDRPGLPRPGPGVAEPGR